MKKLNKMLSLMLVLALCALPLSALAEGKLHTMTLSNFEVVINDEEPIQVDLTLQNTFGADADNFYYNAKLDTGTNPVANFQIAGEDDTLKLKLDGMNSNYQITMEELQQIMEAGMQSSGAAADMPFNAEDLQKMMEAYAKLLTQATELETAEQVSFAQMLDEAGITYETKQEQAQVFDEAVDATRYDVALTTEDLDKMMNYVGQKTPAYKEFMDAYMNYLESVLAASGETIKFDRDNLLKSMYEQLGVDLTIGMTVWSNQDESKVRVEMNEVVVVEAKGDSVTTQTVKVPLVVEAVETGDTQQMRMTMNMDQDGVKMDFNMDVNAQGAVGAQKGDVTMTMSVTEKDQAPTDINMSCTFDETSGEFDFKMGVSAEDVLVNLGLMSVKAGELNRVTLSADATQREENLFKFSLGFDYAQSEAELPAGALLDLSDKPIVNIAQMTQEDAAKLQTDITTVGIMGYGALMQTEGVAKLLSMAMTAITQAATQMAAPVEADA